MPVLVAVKSLCTRHEQASTMAMEADLYFSGLLDSIPLTDRQRWESEIQHAEAHWLQDPAMMDILGAQQMALPEPALPVSHRGQTEVEQWIVVTLDIEEKQSVVF